MNYVGARKKLVDWLRRQLIGPAVEGSLRISPLERYPTGVLHPVEPDLSGIDPASLGDEMAESSLLEDDDDNEESLSADETSGPTMARKARRRRYVPPSSAGFSFYVRGDTFLSIAASAAVYTGTEERDQQGQFLAREYKREVLEEQLFTAPVSRDPEEHRKDLWQGRASIDVRSRPHREGSIVTVTLCNRQEWDQRASPTRRTRDRVSLALFEARLECVIESGALAEYPRVDPSLLTVEEVELELQYRNQKIYAIGHGAAANGKWGRTASRESGPRACPKPKCP